MKVTKPNNFPIVLAGVEKLTPKIIIAGERGMKRGLNFAQQIAMKEFLRGPRPTRLDEVTNRLRSSIAYSVQSNSRGVVGRIGTNVKYAMFHEFGFHGVQNVRAHTRHTANASVDGGSRGIREFKNRDGDRVGARRESIESAEKRGISFTRGQVKAHTRKLNYKGRPFLRPALVKAQPFILTAIKEELEALKP